MGISKKHVPGCACCGGVTECIVSVFDVDGTVCSGSWSRVDQTHTTSSDNALKRDVIALGEPYKWKAHIELDVTPTEVTPGNFASLYSASFGITIHEDECDVYAYLMLDIENTGSGWTYQLRLGRFEAAAENDIVVHPHDPPSCVDVGAMPLDFDMELCFNREYPVATFTGHVEVLPNKTVGTQNYLPIGYGGIKTGTLSAEVNSVNFTCELTRVETTTDAGECEDCEKSCALGTSPTELLVELAGTDSGTITRTDACSTSDCEIPCTAISGTYTTELQEFISNAGCEGDATCRWLYMACIDEYWDCIDPPTDPKQAYIAIVVTVTNTATRAIQVDVYLGISCEAECEPEHIETAPTAYCLVARFGVENYDPVATWTTWIDLDLVTSGYAACNDCSLDGLTCRVKLP